MIIDAIIIATIATLWIGAPVGLVACCAQA